MDLILMTIPRIEAFLWQDKHVFSLLVSRTHSSAVPYKYARPLGLRHSSLSIVFLLSTPQRPSSAAVVHPVCTNQGRCIDLS